jgi:hypothetical protein
MPKRAIGEWRDREILLRMHSMENNPIIGCHVEALLGIKTLLVFSCDELPEQITS